MANIEKRGNSYRITVSLGYDITGKQIKKYMTWKPEKQMTEKQIEKELQRQSTLFEEKARNGLIGDSKQNFAEYSRYVLELKKSQGIIKISTYERYVSFLEYTDIAIGHVKLCDIRPKHLNEFYKQLQADGLNKNTGGKLSNKTILEYHRFISSVLSFAENEMLILFNPARKAKPPKVQKKEVNYLQISDVQDLRKALENAPLKYKLLTLLYLSTGCRRGEIMGLKWNKIDFENKMLYIENNLQYSPNIGIYETTTKTNKNLKYKLSDEVLSLIAEYKREYMQLKLANGDRWQGSLKRCAVGSDKWIENDFVFVQDNGKPMHPDTITSWLNDFSKKNDLPHINPHAFRHTVASILIFSGIDIVTVSHQLGHDKVSTTTDIYSHLLQQANEKATDTLTDVIFNKKSV